ncbi:hypothetical protein BHAOGJBA_2759 [Methylobacterium hispanicum]|jgi:hypothetical protein|uniref:Uncharacterized protein n=1 Tax=Methylobacterium hispanicum TaxID=270350 RepID=A0AAV4ZM90_9HYPH|nr:hypothetical protein BHAOGJBA_2759 [Methylobacterium hispanicum]
MSDRAALLAILGAVLLGAMSPGPRGARRL